MYKEKAKVYTVRYLYFAAVFGGMSWLVFLWWNQATVDRTSNDYLYEQQQTLTREIQSLKLQLKLEE